MKDTMTLAVGSNGRQATKSKSPQEWKAIAAKQFRQRKRLEDFRDPALAMRSLSKAVRHLCRLIEAREVRS